MPTDSHMTSKFEIDARTLMYPNRFIIMINNIEMIAFMCINFLMKKNKTILSSLLLLIVASPLVALNSADFISAKTKVIHLMGERRADPQDQEVQNLLIELAQQSKVITAMEAMDPDSYPEDHCYLGIESRSLYYFNVLQQCYYNTVFSYIFQELAKSLSEQGDYERANALCFILNNITPRKLRQQLDYLNELCDTNKTAFRKLKQQYPLIINIFMELDRVRIYGSSAEFNAILNNYTQSSSIESPSFLKFDLNFAHWINFYAALIRLSDFNHPSIIESQVDQKLAKLRSALNQYLKSPSKISAANYEDIVSNLYSDYQSYVHVDGLNLKQKELLKNIIKHFEDTKNLKLPFYVVVGLPHIPYLASELRKQGYPISLNERAKERLSEWQKEELAF